MKNKVITIEKMNIYVNDVYVHCLKNKTYSIDEYYKKRIEEIFESDYKNNVDIIFDGGYGYTMDFIKFIVLMIADCIEKTRVEKRVKIISNDEPAICEYVKKLLMCGSYNVAKIKII